MAKFDHEIDLPRIFRKNGLSILPISRKEYIISSFKTYEAIQIPSYENAPVFINPNSDFQSLEPRFITSESIALNFAAANGILEDFLEDVNLQLTVNGRMSSGEFNFDIDTATGAKKVTVVNSQIEIDAAYEGTNYLSLFEAKNNIYEDFLIRQLYYPYRVWKDRVTKEIKLVFSMFSNGTFYLYQYRFENPNNYNSITLVKTKKYIISAGLKLPDLYDVLENVQIVQEPKIPFPQADSMPRIINLMEILFKKPMDLSKITEKFGFDVRQTYYYTSAGIYLDYINRDIGAHVVKLTKDGHRIMKLPYQERQLAIFATILEHSPFNETLRIYLSTGNIPSKAEIIEIMKRTNLYNIHGVSTYERRASTVKSWIEWILSVIEN